MVAIKDMKMPSSCKECKDKRIDHITFELCLRTGRNVVDCRDYRHCDCPLVEIQPLTDREQRIFLSAMSREEVVCKQIDIDKVDDGSTLKLVPICKSIERKVKKALWR